MDLKELFSLDGKTALITGAARGLGQEIALALAQYGASLILADTEPPQETAERVEQCGRRCLAVQTDISDESQVEKMTRMARDEFGQVDILVNNAGVSQLSYTATEELPVAEWDRIVAINLRGTFLCCKHVGKLMIRHGGGSIVNIASTAGVTGVSRAPAYSASKSGIILLAKSLALEWARYNIRVNSIAPHYLETNLTEGLRNSAKVHEAIVKQIPLRRFGKVSEVVGAVVYLSSNAASFTTGAVIPVDGGYLAQ